LYTDYDPTGYNMDFFRRHEGHKEVKNDQYWAFGYSFEALNHEQKHQRRDYLNWYGFVAQWSVLAIFVIFQMSFFFGWLVESGLKHETPKSPSFTKASDRLGWLRKVHVASTKTRWWMSKDLIAGWNWGTRGEWVGATAWTGWLLYLCIANTGHGKDAIIF
jgi:hypothetical protein